MAIEDLGTVRIDGPPLRVLHAADLHLGSSPTAAAAFGALVGAALHHEVDVVLLAGDIYDRADREVSAQLAFIGGLRRLTAAGAHVFIVHGNHDPSVGRFAPVAAMPTGVHVFDPGAPQTYRLTVAGRTVAITGVSFAVRHERENLVRRIGATTVDADLRIGLVHANVAGLPGHDDYAGCSPDDLAHSPIHYWALGHIHDRTVCQLGPGRWWVYPGNLQGRSTKATECGPKGVVVLQAGATGFEEPTFVPCDQERFARVEVDVSGTDTVDAALQVVADHLEHERAEAAGRPLWVRLTIAGSTAASASLASLSIEDVTHHTGARVHLTALIVATSLPLERASLAAQPDVLGAVLRRVDAMVGSDVGPVVDLASHALGPVARRSAQDSYARGQVSGAELLAEVERLMVAELGPGEDQLVDGVGR